MLHQNLSQFILQCSIILETFVIHIVVLNCFSSKCAVTNLDETGQAVQGK